MIDFVKLDLIDMDSNLLLENPYLHFKDIVETKTGEIGKYQQAIYNGLKFKIYHTIKALKQKGRITLEGSLHKYWNKGKHNFNDFGITELYSVIEEIEKKFKINPSNCEIKQLEIGMNLIVNYKIPTFLSYCIMHKKSLFKWGKTKEKSNFLQCEHQRYIIKIYDKSLQYRKLNYKIDNEILRFEIKFKNMQDLRKNHNINTLENLLNFKPINFIQFLVEEWKNVLFYEDEIFKGSKNEFKYNNPNFWNNLKPDNFKYHRSEMYKRINGNPKSIKNQIIELLNEKGNHLLKTTRINY